MKFDSMATGGEAAAAIATATNFIFLGALELGEHWKHYLNKFQIKKLHQVGNWNEEQKKKTEKKWIGR